MRTALEYYFNPCGSLGYDGKVLGYKAVAKIYGLPKETFRRRTTREISEDTRHIYVEVS